MEQQAWQREAGWSVRLSCQLISSVANVLPPHCLDLEHDQLGLRDSQTLPRLGHMASLRLEFPGAGGKEWGRKDTGRGRSTWQRQENFGGSGEIGVSEQEHRTEKRAHHVDQAASSVLYFFSTDGSRCQKVTLSNNWGQGGQRLEVGGGSMTVLACRV